MQETNKLPILPIRDPTLVVFPYSSVEINVGRELSLNALDMAQDGIIIIAMQKKETVNEPTANDFYSICTKAKIQHILDLDNEGIRKKVIIGGLNRAELRVIGNSKGKYLVGEIVNIQETEVTIDDDTSELISNIYDLIKEQCKEISLNKKTKVVTTDQLSQFTDHICAQLPVSRRVKLTLLKELNPKKRLTLLFGILLEYTKQIKIEFEPEQISIQNESQEVKRLTKLANESGMPDDVLQVVKQELKRLNHMPPSMSEFPITINYVETLASLPWDKKTEDKIDIEDSKRILDEDHYGLEKFKERILEYLAVRKLNKDRKGAILCFHGPPGCGKTSSGKSIARAMNRKFIRMSLGGVHDEAEIRGHRRTYVGAMVGKIIQHIKKVGVKNPLFMLDEVDKLSKDYRGDPASALLEVLDPEQNNSFTDNYLNVPFDLSDVLFICTVNEVHTIPPALKDRLEIIDIQGYSPYDKLKIAQNHLIKKQKEINGLQDYNISISQNALNKIIEEYTSEAGVRSLERNCGAILRKIAIMVASDKKPPSIIKSSSLLKLLGPPKIFVERAVEEPEIGLCAGLSCNSNGGSLLFVESSLTFGKGDVKLTGNLGKVLQESIKASYTWIKANSKMLGIDLEKINKSDVHIHFPSGAIPKDGPSAGVAITSVMLSSFLDKPIPNDVAMTGEISLRGRVLPIGGLVEKTLAAHRAGIRHVLYPEKNKCDLEEIPEDVRDNIKMTPVSTIKEVLNILFN